MVDFNFEKLRTMETDELRGILLVGTDMYRTDVVEAAISELNSRGIRVDDSEIAAYRKKESAYEEAELRERRQASLEPWQKIVFFLIPTVGFFYMFYAMNSWPRKARQAFYCCLLNGVAQLLLVWVISLADR